MKVLFAVHDEKDSLAIVKKYQKEYKEIISYKNVYYFNAILKELQRDKTYDRIVIDEELEEITSTSYEEKDKYIFNKLDDITDEALNVKGKEIPIILICSERRTKAEEILVKMFGIGIYNAIIGNDRSQDEVCRLINHPRAKKEAKLYYKIYSKDVEYDPETENDVSEEEMQNILGYFKRLGNDEEKIVDSFKKISAQYNEKQMRIIVAVLPLNIKSVLEEASPEYQRIVSNSGGKITQRTNTEKESATSEKLIQLDNPQKPSGPVVVPTKLKKNIIKKVAIKKPAIPKENTEQINMLNKLNSTNVEKDLDEFEEVKIEAKPLNKNEIIKTTSAEENINEIPEVEEPPKKRKRGRPPKKQTQEIKKEQIQIEDLKEVTIEPKETSNKTKLKLKIKEDDDLFADIDNQNQAEKEIEEDTTDEVNFDEERKIENLNENQFEYSTDFSNDDNREEHLPILYDDEDDNENYIEELKKARKNKKHKIGKQSKEEELFDVGEDEYPTVDLEDDDDEDEFKYQKTESHEEFTLPDLDEDEEDDNEFTLPDSDDAEEDDDTEFTLPDLDDAEEDDDTEFTLPDVKEKKVKKSTLQDLEEEFTLPNIEKKSFTEPTKNFVLPEIKANEEDEYDYTNYNNLLSGDRKTIVFVGTSKNGTSFIVNNVAQILSQNGIDTAILDATQNKNSYYIYNKNDESLRMDAANSINSLIEGNPKGMKVSDNLTVYVEVPGQYETQMNNAGPILENLVRNHSAVLIDCDFETPFKYFEYAQEIFLVQSMDALTIQPLTAFLKELKNKGILQETKLRIIVNKAMRLRNVTSKAIVGGMSRYNNPEMSIMTDLFDRNMIAPIDIPFDPDVYAKYLDGVADCYVDVKKYPKEFQEILKRLSAMVYPLLPSKKSKQKRVINDRSEATTPQYSSGFSNSVNNTLNNMKKKY